MLKGKIYFKFSSNVDNLVFFVYICNLEFVFYFVLSSS